MQGVRKAWTDERLDDLATKVDRGFDRVDTDLGQFRAEMNSRFDAMQRTMVIGFVSVLAAFASALAAIVATRL